MQNARDVLLKILDAIDYADDKEVFVNKFLQNIDTQALLDLFNTLPQDKKDQIKGQLTSIRDNPQESEQVLKTYFTNSQIQDALQNASKNAVAEYIKAIDSTLSESQRNNLANLPKELNQNISTAQPNL